MTNLQITFKIEDPVDESVILTFSDGYEIGGIEMDEGFIDFVFNIAPDEQDGDINPEEAKEWITNEFNHLNRLKTLMELLEDNFQMGHNFYWNEGDLNVTIRIPKNHPVFKNLNFKL